MPYSDKPGLPDGCYFCDGRAGALHHISYQPENVVLLCSSCHNKVHSNGYDGDPLHPDLTPDVSRSEWKEEVWDGEWIPRPEPDQIEWNSEDVGTVKR